MKIFVADTGFGSKKSNKLSSDIAKLLGIKDAIYAKFFDENANYDSHPPIRISHIITLAQQQNKWHIDTSIKDAVVISRRCPISNPEYFQYDNNGIILEYMGKVTIESAHSLEEFGYIIIEDESLINAIELMLTKLNVTYRPVEKTNDNVYLRVKDVLKKMR